MIAVIADDLTGAAELGGIGLRHGLRTEVRMGLADPASSHAAANPTTAPGAPGNEAALTSANPGPAPGSPDPAPDLLVIAGDSRSKSESAAIQEMAAITHQLQNLQPEWLYKKSDSVLRGHVMAELRTHLELLGLGSALLIPANPALGRTIKDGHYFLNDRPIHHSAFSIDPEFPIFSSDIQDMLHTTGQPVQVKKVDEELPATGVVVGEVQDSADLQTWARRLPPGTLAAGAAGFFSALLDRQFPMAAAPQKTSTTNPGAADGHVFAHPLLFVSGSTFDRSRNAIQRQKDAGAPVTYMPMDPDDTWQELIASMLKKQGKAIVAIDPKIHDHSAHELRTMMADAIAGVLRKTKPAEIIIEGGATAYAILQKTGWQRFIPEQELAPGLIRMRVGDTSPAPTSAAAASGAEPADTYVTVKPGSYPWPDNISY